MRGALEGFPEVRRVDYNPRGDIFKVQYRSAEFLGDRLKQAADATVVAPGMRRALETLGGRPEAEKPEGH